MQVKICYIILVCIYFFGCNQENNHKDHPVTKAFDYLSKNDPYFEKRLKDTIFLFTKNHDLFDSEISEGDYLFAEQDWESPSGKIVFKQLNVTSFDEKIIVEILSKYISKNKIIKIEKIEDLHYNYRLLNSQEQGIVPKKWLFNINNFRRNEKYGIFQILYQANTRSILGCVFIYDFEKNEIVAEACDM